MGIDNQDSFDHWAEHVGRQSMEVNVADLKDGEVKTFTGEIPKRFDVGIDNKRKLYVYYESGWKPMN
jgi:hypothetical protein